MPQTQVSIYITNVKIKYKNYTIKMNEPVQHFIRNAIAAAGAKVETLTTPVKKNKTGSSTSSQY